MLTALPVEVEFREALEQPQPQVLARAHQVGPEQVQSLLEVLQLGVVGVAVFRPAAQVEPDVRRLKLFAGRERDQYIDRGPAMPALCPGVLRERPWARRN